MGIWITPPAPGAAQNGVEVVSVKRKWPGAGEEDWEKKVLRDLHRVLAGESIR